MKIKRHLSWYPSGMPIAGKIGNQNPILTCKRLDLPVKRINLVSPATMEKNEGLAAAEFAVVDLNGTHAGRVRRLRQFQSGHSVSPLAGNTRRKTSRGQLSSSIHGPYLTT